MTENASPVLDDDGHFHATDDAVDLSIYKWEDWLALAAFVLLALDVFYQFFTRYVLSDSAAWTEEIARYLLIIIVFIGAATAVRRDTHIHVEFLYRYLPAKLARAASTAIDVMRVAFFAYAFYLCCQLVPKMHVLKMTVIDVPMSVIYSFVALGFLVGAWRAVGVMVRNWKRGWSILERPMEGI